MDTHPHPTDRNPGPITAGCKQLKFLLRGSGVSRSKLNVPLSRTLGSSTITHKEAGEQGLGSPRPFRYGNDAVCPAGFSNDLQIDYVVRIEFNLLRWYYDPNTDVWDILSLCYDVCRLTRHITSYALWWGLNLERFRAVTFSSSTWRRSVNQFNDAYSHRDRWNNGTYPMSRKACLHFLAL